MLNIIFTNIIFMKKYSGFTLLEILLYVVIGGITLVIASFSFVQINRLSTSFRVNNELNQNGDAITGQIQNLVNDADTIISPKAGDSANNNLILRKGIVDITITQATNNITVSYSDNSTNPYNLNPTGILVVVNTTSSPTPSPTLSFQQINTKDNNDNLGLAQTIKLKFTLKYNKPTLSGFEYDAEKSFETTLNLANKTSSFQPILNTQPIGANGVAYGLRKLSGFNTNPNQLSSAYNGAAIKVRRGDSAGSIVYDNAEMDIGFTSKGELDQVALQNFVGYQNYLKYSEDITNASWVLSKDINNNNTISITADITNTTVNNTAPNGTNTAERVNLLTGTSNRSISNNTSIVNGSTYTDSYYVRAKDTNNDGNFNNDDNFVQIATSTGFSNSTYQNYNLKGIGTLANKSTDIAINQSGITQIGNNGWYRIWLTATATSSTSSGGMILSILNSDTPSRLPSFTITSDTDSIFVWGAMRHLGSTLKPYQKTDINTNTGDGYVTTWYDQSGNKNNAIQATTSAQPKIVDGVNGIIKENNKPVIQFDGNDQLNTDANIIFNNPNNSTAFFVASRAANNQSFMARLNSYDSYDSYATLGPPDLFNTYYLNTAASAGADTKNSLNLYTAIRTSGIDSTLAIGAGSTGNFLNGNMAELIIYDGNKLSNRTVIENNLRDYYGTEINF